MYVYASKKYVGRKIVNSGGISSSPSSPTPHFERTEDSPVNCRLFAHFYMHVHTSQRAMYMYIIKVPQNYMCTGGTAKGFVTIIYCEVKL